MNVDLSAMPVTIDLVHVILSALAILFLVLFVTKKGAKTEAPAPVAPQESKPAPQLKEASPDGALQLLALLQQDARFIDFVQQDLGDYSDAQIGAAARVVHEGSQKMMKTYFELSPIRDEQEESPVTIPAGFDATTIRLTGNVVGEAPFKGILVHRGWKITNSKLPKLAEGHNTKIVAPAEVEL